MRGRRAFHGPMSTETSDSGGTGLRFKRGISVISTTWRNSTGQAGPWSPGAVRRIRQAATVSRASRRREMSRGRARGPFHGPMSTETSGSSVTGLRFEREYRLSQRPMGIQRDELGLGRLSGSVTGNQAGSYGTQGVAAAGNVPGARSGTISWTDAQGDLWLFGGQGTIPAATRET